MKVEVVSPERILSQTEANEVIIPTAAGTIGVRQGHIPVVAPLAAGEVEIKGQNPGLIAISGGFVEVQPDLVRIMADSAIHSQDLDEQKIQQAIEHAQKLQEQAKDQKDIDAAYILLQQHMGLLKVAQKRRHHR